MFTDTDKIQLLEAAGYIISSRERPVSKNPDSIQHLMLVSEPVAAKNGKTISLDEAFNEEIKPILSKMNEITTIERLINYKKQLLEADGKNELLYDEKMEQETLRILQVFKERYASTNQHNIVAAMPPEEYLQYIEFKEFQNYKQQKHEKTDHSKEENGQNAQKH